MGIFNRSDTAMDEIRCDESDYLVWKWRPSKPQKNKGNRENAIRWGSSLRVREGSVAVFVHNQNDGTYQDFIEGPCDQILQTENLPVLSNIIGFAYGGGTPFQAEVYFINLAQVVQMQFAIPFFDTYDPRFPDFGIPTAVRGTLTFHIENYREFIRLHSLAEFTLDKFEIKVRDAVMRYLKPAIASAPATYKIPLIQIERSIGEICTDVVPDIKNRMSSDFGINVTGIDISAIEFDKASRDYQRLMAITQEMTMQTIQAQTEVNIKNLRDQQQINSDNLAESLRIQREQSQYAQRKQTQSANFAAYQLEQQAAVGVAGAQALGQMGANGATQIGVPAGGGWVMDPAAIATSMAIGSTLGQNMASMINGVISEPNHPVQQSAPTPQTPPSASAVSYHVVINGSASGPFDASQLTALTATGSLTTDSLVWTAGMNDWHRAGSIPELAPLFLGRDQAAPPPIPGT